MPAMQTIMRPLTAMLLALALIFVAALLATQNTSAFAQSSPASPPSPASKPVSGATPGGTDSGSSSDAELWRKIRQGSSGMVVGGDKSGGLMIQSGGQDWRLMREGALPKYTAWAILGTLLLLSLFFAFRGRIKIESGRSGVTMQRFSLLERVGHWMLASSFILLALTGLNLIFGRSLLIPLLGKESFASITVFGKFIHNYVGFAFMLGLAIITFTWILKNFPTKADFVWILKAGGLFGKGHAPAGKFNAGQKMIFWVVIWSGLLISISGWALMNPFTVEMFGSVFGIINSVFGTEYATNLAPIQEQQYQSLLHSIMSAVMVAVIIAHIYIGTIGMEGSLEAMTTGDVDTNWAKEHHNLWVEEEEAKKWSKGDQATQPAE